MFIRGFTVGSVASFTSVILYNIVNKDNKVANKDAPVSKDAHEVRTGSNILKYGIPQHGHQILYYENHVLAYDQAKRTPAWVAESITKKNTKGPANRKNVKFKSDPRVPALFTAVNDDYWHSGWSRGHMSPAGDNKNSQDAMVESFFLSNIVPQDLNNNAGFWNRLEMYCRDLTERFNSVQIYSGPLLLPNGQTEDGKHETVTYQVIGNSKVAVPTHLYKIIIVEDDDNNPVAMGSFIVPNMPLDYGRTLKEFQVPVSDLERKSGILFTPKLDTANVKDLCQVDSCKLMNKDEFDLYMFARRLGGSRSRGYLQKVWDEMETKNLKPTDYHLKIYNEKLKEFEDAEPSQERVAQRA